MQKSLSLMLMHSYEIYFRLNSSELDIFPLNLGYIVGLFCQGTSPIPLRHALQCEDLPLLQERACNISTFVPGCSEAAGACPDFMSLILGPSALPNVTTS